ncbi:MAG: hypothetical protein QE277_10350 [Flectobacillus sp.]|nr:hypothetical protein [Flectobacillus sp.]
MQKLFILLLIVFFFQPLLAQRKRLPSPINTDFIESAPSVSADKEFLIYQSNSCDPSLIPNDGTGNTSSNFYNCIIESKRHPSGEYQNPQPIEAINSFFKNTRVMGNPTISYDGNTIWLSGRVGIGRLANDDIFFSVRTKDGWSTPINPGNLINTSQNEVSPCLSADGKKLYFAREDGPSLGGHPNYKIYVATRRNVNAPWESPVLMQYTINQGSSFGPRIHVDGKTLYFSSIRGNREDYDLYLSRLQEDGSWSEALPLKFLNTRREEVFASVNPCGDQIYYAHDGDLYETILPEEFCPQKCITLQGYVLDSATQKSIYSTFTVRYKSDTSTTKLTNYSIFSSLDNEENDHRITAFIPTILNNECEVLVKNKLYFPKSMSVIGSDFSTCEMISKEISLPMVPVPIPVQSKWIITPTQKTETKDFRK